MAKVRLTADFIQNRLVPPEGKARVEFCDTEVPGLYIAVSQLSPGRGVYYLRWKNPKGTTAHTKIAKTDEITLSDARKRALALKAEIFRGSDPQEQQRQQRKVPTFDEFFTEHYLPVIKAKNRSWASTVQVYNCRIKERFGNIRLDQVSRQEIIRMHLLLKEQGLSGATCDHAVAVMRTVFNYAISLDVVNRNPAKIKLFKQDNKRSRYVTSQELPGLLHVLRTDSNKNVCAVVMFLLSTGVRVSEALTAEWKDINFETRILTVRATNSKSRKARHVPLNDAALDVLKSLPRRDGQGFVFRSSKTGDRMKYISKVWERLRREAGIEDVRLHDLRHSAASYMASAGVPLFSIQQVLGHADSSTTIRYMHLSDKALQHAASAVSDKLSQVPDNPSEAA